MCKEKKSELLVEDYGERRLTKDLKISGKMVYDNVNSLYLGRHPCRRSTRPQKFFKAPFSSLIYYENNKDFMDEFGVEVSRGVVSKGCYSTNYHTLRRQLVPLGETKFTQGPSKAVLEKFEKNFIHS